MFEFLRQLTSGITEAWGRLSTNARVQIGASAALTILLLGGAVYMGARPNFAPLYTGIEQSEADEVRIYLEDQGIPFLIRNGGRAVEIPARNISAVRVALAGQGIPKSQGVSSDFGIFDNRSLMTNEFLQDMDFMRALNGTLQRQLNQFDFVRNSTAMIRKAEESMFRSHQQPSEAVVALELVGGSLTEAQKKAVLHTISTFGGGNLSTNNITITSTSAPYLIHSPVEDAYASLVSSRHEQQVAWESERERKIVESFAAIGEKAVINVTAIHDWSTEDIHDTAFGEAVPIASSSDKMDTTTSEGGTLNGVAPGAVANIPDGDTGGTTTNTISESNKIDNFDFPTTITQSSKAPGRIKKLMVAAIIEGDTIPDANGDPQYIGLTQQQLDSYQAMILMSVGEGYEDALANDGASRISIMDQPFDVSPTTAVASAPISASLLQNPQLWQAVQGFLILLSFILLRIFIRRAMVLPTTEVEEVVELPQMSEEDRQSQEIAAEVERLSQEEPEMVAALLRTWMAEDD